MRKIVFILALFISAAIISCSDSSGDDSEKGYVDPGLDTPKTVNSNKAFNLTGVGETCGPNSQCNAIIYQGKLNNVSYVGIAVNDSHSGSPDFNLKIYWNGSSIPADVNLAPADYSIIVNKIGTEYTSTSDNLDLTITPQGDGTYLITFDSAIDLGGQSINIGSTIRAYKYP